MSTHRRALTAIACLALSVSLTLAFVQETGNGTARAHWPGMPVMFGLNSRGTSDLVGEGAFAAVRTSFATWDAVANSDLAFQELPGLVPNEVADDGTNAIVWIENATHPLVQARGAIATTNTRFFVASGEIFDADTWLDGVH